MTTESAPSGVDATIGPRWLPGLLVVIATLLAVVTHGDDVDTFAGPRHRSVGRDER